MWLKDTNSAGCNSYPYCWLEGGYDYAPYNGHSYYDYVAWINPAGTPTIDVLADIPLGQTGNVYLAFYRYDANDFNISYQSPNYYNNNIPVQVQDGMSPNYIQIGMRLSGSGGSTSGTAAFTNNCYYVSGNCYQQTNPGNPTQGYVSQPPFGFWKTQPSPSNPGGEWTTVAQTSPAVLAGYNAVGMFNANPWGVRADITTGDPKIRDANGWSWVRTTVQNLSNASTNDFSELGWYKDNTGIYVAISYSTSGNFYHFNLNIHPTVNVIYTYQLLWDSNNQEYLAYFNGSLVAAEAGPLNVTDIFCGGETYSTNDAMGISSCLANQYAQAPNGAWTTYPSHYAFYSPSKPSNPYTLSDIDNSDWQVSGNN